MIELFPYMSSIKKIIRKQPQINKNEIKKILVIQTAFIGDVVLTTPMLKSIKQCLPDIYLTVLVKPEAKPILEPLDFIDEIMIIDKKKKHKFLGMFSMIQKIRKQKYDAILSPHQSFRSGLLCLFSGSPYRVGYISSSLPYAYHILLERKRKHEIHRLLDFVRYSLCPEMTFLTTTPILEETEISIQNAKKLLKDFSSPPIAFACSSIWPTKRWTPWGFAELAGKLMEKYHSSIILIGSKDDYELSEHIRNIAMHILPENKYKKIFNFCGKTDLITLYSLLKRCKLLVSNDSAPVHFGCAAKIPVIAIFGPTTKELGYAPICKHSKVVEIKNLYCRPCGTHGGKTCPEKHFRCMKEITPDMVMKSIQSLI